MAVYFVAAAALATAIVPVLADFDTTSVIGWVGGLGALAGVVGVWLNGWQKYEERTDLQPLVEQQLGSHPDA